MIVPRSLQSSRIIETSSKDASRAFAPEFLLATALGNAPWPKPSPSANRSPASAKSEPNSAWSPSPIPSFFSDSFSLLSHQNKLYEVLQILKQIRDRHLGTV
jgi:hypothetical protein